MGKQSVTMFILRWKHTRTNKPMRMQFDSYGQAMLRVLMVRELHPGHMFHLNGRKVDGSKTSIGECTKCGHKVGIGIKVTPVSEARKTGVPHVKAVQTDYLIRCSMCEKEWCCLECAIEYDAVDHRDFKRTDISPNGKPFIIKCCHCTGKKRCWE